VAIAKNAPHRADAIRFLEFLVSDEGQQLYARANFEYPVKAGVAADPIIAGLGMLKPDAVSLTEIAKHRKAASTLADKVGFDN
jgi:iron(III) transport system substrate-binding protein